MSGNAPNLVFAINGEKVSIPGSEVDPTLTVNSFLRERLNVGTKKQCGEGGCGACAVLVSNVDPDDPTKVVHKTVNSCLRPVATLMGCNVTTVEGIGSRAKGFHPIQERLASFNGTQCGFCSPGMVMAMYGSLKANGGEGGKNVSMKEVENYLDGNICRCTGYRPILDAFKSFASDSNITDQICGNSALGPYDESLDPAFPDFLKEVEMKAAGSFQTTGAAADCAGGECTWHRPGSVEEASSLAQADDSAFVVGNTSTGIYKRAVPKKVMIDLSGIPELNTITKDQGSISFGAAVTLKRAIDAFQASDDSERKGFAVLARHIRKIANVHVRNAGSLAGNLAMQKQFGFKSDLATIFTAAGAVLTLYSDGKRSECGVIDYMTTAPDSSMIVSIRVPALGENEYINTYKISIRPQNAHAYINAGFRFSLANNTIKDARCVFGGVGAEDVKGSRAVIAVGLGEYLVGKAFTNETLQGGLKILGSEVVPATPDWAVGCEPELEQSYLQSLVCSLFYKFFLQMANTAGGTTVSDLKTAAPVFKERAISRGTQKFPVIDGVEPMHKPIQKISGKLQCAGELPYTDDLRPTAGTLYAGYVTSTYAHATINGVDASAALAIDGVVRFISEADLNVKTIEFPGCFIGPFPIFAQDKTVFYGQPIGVVLATSKRLAESAALKVRVSYTPQKAVLTIPNSVKAGTIEQDFPAESILPAAPFGELKHGDAENVKDDIKVGGTLNIGTQKHFYMEMNTAYVQPDEDGSYIVNASIQFPDQTVFNLGKVLGISHNRIRIIHRRSGGSFGAKGTFGAWHATVAAVCAQLTGQPVKVNLSLAQDMRITGGRCDGTATYEVSCNKEGNISAINNRAYFNPGCGVEALAIPLLFNRSLHEAYEIPNLQSISSLLITNTAKRTFTRGPGELSAGVLMETMIERVAHATGLSPEVVRERNFYKEDDTEKVDPFGMKCEYYTIHQLWKQCKEKAKFDERLAAIKVFNEANRWVKKGISMTTVNYANDVMIRQANVTLFVDGSVIITSGGTEMGQGLETKAIQMAAYCLGKFMGKPFDIDHIRYHHMDSYSMPNANMTSGSTTSEGVCLAIEKACAELEEGLKPVYDDLVAKNNELPEAEQKEVTFADVCIGARTSSVLLSRTVTIGKGEGLVNSLWGLSISYHNYGVCCSEVTVDMLTGETTIDSVNMMYDSGRSLNPAIDIGQMEGAFMMGVGAILREQEVLAPTGKLLSEGTWLYKPPEAGDVPLDFNIELLQNHAFEKGIMSSKSCGEPPLVLSSSVLCAVRQAVKAFREQQGNKEWFDLHIPATPAAIQQAALVDPTTFYVTK